MTEWTNERVAWLQARATAAGFTLAGVAAAAGHTAAEQVDGDRFERWIEAGFAGEMDYLKRRNEQGQLLRTSIPVAIPWAQSVVVCAINYRAEGPLSTAAAHPDAGWIGRYAWSGTPRQTPGAEPSPSRAPIAGVSSGALSCDTTPPAADHLQPTDYHEVLLSRLHLLEADIQAAMPCQSRCYVDTGPMVERAAAARAGVGWIGKNTTVINQQIGSWTLLASIITSLPVAASGVAIAAVDRCGTCTRCIDACPTDALHVPHQMDARRCIAYLTIEKKGSIDPELREGMGRQVFGCDICQDVCPWNRQTPIVADPAMLPRQQLINPDLEWLAQLTSTEFRQWFKGSPLERTGRKRLHRNVAIAMGNSGQQHFRHRLETWSAGDDPVLAEAARWALTRLHNQSDPEPPSPWPATS